jgi:hypothetical protein
MVGMKRGITSVGLVAATAAFLAFAAQPAVAATTIGQTNAPASTVACDTNATYVQEGVSSGAAGYQSPVSGVITSWSTAQSSAATQMKLVVLRPDAPSGAFHYIPKQKDVLRDISALNQINTFTGLHLAIAAGDYIGLYVPAAGANCLSYTAGSGETYHHILSDPPLDTSAFFNNVTSSGLINASAVIEPDADGDGFGDESQDGCPGNGAATGACPVAPPPAAVTTDNAALRAAALKRCKKKPTPLAKRKCAKRAKKKFA